MCYTHLFHLLRNDIDNHHHPPTKHDQSAYSSSHTGTAIAPSRTPSVQDPPKPSPNTIGPGPNTNALTPIQSSPTVTSNNGLTPQPSNTSDLTFQPSALTPLAQNNALKGFVSSTFNNQNNITAYRDDLNPRLQGYFRDYVATKGYRQPPNCTQSTIEVQRVGNWSCDSSTTSRKRTVTDIYILQTILSQKSQHIQRAKEMIGINSCP